jgi:hypothetical protein
MLQSTVWMPAPARTASKAAVKFEVHDQVAGLLGGPRPVGYCVTPRMRIRLLACSITASILWNLACHGHPLLPLPGIDDHE